MGQLVYTFCFVSLYPIYYILYISKVVLLFQYDINRWSVLDSAVVIVVPVTSSGKVQDIETEPPRGSILNLSSVPLKVCGPFSSSPWGPCVCASWQVNTAPSGEAPALNSPNTCRAGPGDVLQITACTC